MKCPICEKQIEDYQLDTDEHGIYEEHATCKDDEHLYHYAFEYGNWTEVIGDIIINGNWEDSDEEKEDKGNIATLATELAKKHYKPEELK